MPCCYCWPCVAGALTGWHSPRHVWLPWLFGILGRSEGDNIGCHIWVLCFGVGVKKQINCLCFVGSFKAVQCFAFHGVPLDKATSGIFWIFLCFFFYQPPVVAAQVSLLLTCKDIGPIATRSPASTNWISKVGCKGQTSLSVKFCGVLESEGSEFSDKNSTQLLKCRCVDL